MCEPLNGTSSSRKWSAFSSHSEPMLLNSEKASITWKPTVTTNMHTAVQPQQGPKPKTDTTTGQNQKSAIENVRRKPKQVLNNNPKPLVGYKRSIMQVKHKLTSFLVLQQLNCASIGSFAQWPTVPLYRLRQSFCMFTANSSVLIIASRSTSTKCQSTRSSKCLLLHSQTSGHLPHTMHRKKCISQN